MKFFYRKPWELLRGYFKILLIMFTLMALVAGCSSKKPVETLTPGTDIYKEKPVDFKIPDIQKGPGEQTFSSGMDTNLEITGIPDDGLGLPVAVCQDKDGNTYVLDLYSTEGLVKVFDPLGRYFFKLAPLQAPESQPVDVAVDSSGNVYVADLGLRVVLKWDKTGKVKKIQPHEDFFPRSLAVDSRDNLVVMSFDRVYKFEGDGKISYFGESGNQEGQFGAAGSEFYNGPTGITVDRDDNIFVADTLNSRIQKFSPEGNFIKAYTLDDSPQDVAVKSDGKIYAITSGRNLLEMSPEGEIIDSRKEAFPEEGFFGIAVGRDDTLLVTVAAQHEVKVYVQGSEIYSIRQNLSKGFINPHNMSVYKGHVAIVSGDPFLSDDLNNRILVFDKSGKFVSEVLPGYSSGGFFGPQDVAFLNEKLYLLDLDMISVYDMRHNFILSFGGRGENPGDFGVYNNFGEEQGPAAIEASPDGELVISDTFNDRIQKITTDGKYAGGFDVPSPGPMDIDEDGNIYVVLPQKARVVKFSPRGEKLLEFGEIGASEGEFTLENGEWDSRGPDGIALDEKNNLIYVSDTAANRIQVFNFQGKFVKSIGGFGTGRGEFYYPRDLALDEEGFLWVADSGNHRVVRLNVK